MGEKMFLVPQSVLESLVNLPANPDDYEAALHKAQEILAGTVVHKRPVDLADLTDWQRSQVARQVAAEQRCRFESQELKSIEVDLNDVQKEAVTPKEAVVLAPEVEALLKRGVLPQTDGRHRLTLGVTPMDESLWETLTGELATEPNLTVNLGQFNIPPEGLPAHRNYRIDEQALRDMMFKKVGHILGEINQSSLGDSDDPAVTLERIMRVEESRGWGRLTGYSVDRAPSGMLSVTGNVLLTTVGREYIESLGYQPLHVSVRSHGQDRWIKDSVTPFDVRDIVAFDLCDK
jgi:hypothetical protein